jgi:hypothetical protein
MLDPIVTAGARFLTWLFVIGTAGCLVVIPIAAYKMFSVLFEEDRFGEK